MHLIASIFKFFFKFVWMIFKGFGKACWFYTKFIIAFVIIVFSLIMFAGFAVKSDIPAPDEKKLLLIKPEGIVTDHHMPELNYLVNSLAGDTSISYSDEIVRAINLASRDTEHILGIVVDLSTLSSISYGTSDVIGKALLDYQKATGKKVYFYSDTYTQQDYYLATFGSLIIMNPAGDVDLSGITIGQVYFKDLLDSWGITPLVFKSGRYKSAVEPFTNQKMSDDSRENLNSIINDIWGNVSSVIAENRKIPQDKILRSIDEELSDLRELNFNTYKDLKKRNVINFYTSPESFKKLLCSTYTSIIQERNKVAMINYEDYLRQNPEIRKPQRTYPGIIKVIHLTGDVDSSGKAFHISYESYREEFHNILNDPFVKAIVLRINTPGGSVSEAIKITNALRFLKRSGKKIIVSMGDMTASAGYWISAEADWIVAQPYTLTGSIGVFCILPSVNKLAEKYGVHYDEATNNPHHFSNPLQELDEREKELITGKIDRIYERFLKLVAEGRKMELSQVQELAQGRIWTGSQAKEHNLVNEVGYLDDAVRKAVELSKMGSNFKVEHFYGDFTTDFHSLQKIMSKSSAIADLFTLIFGYMPESYLSNFKMAIPSYTGVPQDHKAEIYSYLPVIMRD